MAAGLPLGGEAVWPGLRNDLLVAHESIYSFAARDVEGLRVLDAACGTGYGSDLLARAGAASVLGIDRNARRIRFAGRRYRSPGLSFDVRDCQAMGLPPDSFDRVVSSNTLEHLEEPRRFLRGAGAALTRGGEIFVAVPPVFSEADLEAHAENPDHLSNLPVRTWAELFANEGWTYRYFAHRCSEPLDFRSFRPSTVRPEDFLFEEEDPVDQDARASITAVFLLRRTEENGGSEGAHR